MYSFTLETTSGLYRKSAGVLSMAVLGTEVGSFQSGGWIGNTSGTHTGHSSLDVSLDGTSTMSGPIRVAGTGQTWFAYRDLAALSNYGTFLRTDGAALGYLGGGAGGAISGATASDLALRSTGNLILSGPSGTNDITIAASGAITIPGLVQSTASEALRIFNGAGFLSGYNAIGTIRTGYIQFNSGTDVRVVSEATNSIILQTAGGTLTLATGGWLTATGNFSAANVLSATYAPTLTGLTNIDSITGGVFRYIRIGNTVHVNGSMTVDPTAVTNTTLSISLPVASNFTTTQQAAGIASCGNVANLPGQITSDAATDKAILSFTASSTSAFLWTVDFVYDIV
jgi:hypothetical protein